MEKLTNSYFLAITILFLFTTLLLKLEGIGIIATYSIFWWITFPVWFPFLLLIVGVLIFVSILIISIFKVSYKKYKFEKIRNKKEF